MISDMRVQTNRQHCMFIDRVECISEHEVDTAIAQTLAAMAEAWHDEIATNMDALLGHLRKKAGFCQMGKSAGFFISRWIRGCFRQPGEIRGVDAYCFANLTVQGVHSGSFLLIQIFIATHLAGILRTSSSKIRSLWMA